MPDRKQPGLRGQTLSGHVNGSFISESSALVHGPAAWLLSRILHSEHVTTVLNQPPVWIERGDITDMINAIDLAAEAFDASQTALERGKMTTLGATVPYSTPNWTTRQTADYLKISRRRAQEIAADLGGTRIGRHWVIPVVAVRQLAEHRAMS